MNNITIIGVVVILISAITAWLTSTIAKNVDLKQKTKTFLVILYFITAIALAIGFLFVSAKIL